MNLRNFYTTYLRIIVGTLSSLFCFVTAFHIPISFLHMLPFCISVAWFLLFLYEKKGQVIGDRALLICLLILGIQALLFRTWIPDAIDSIIYYIQKELMNVHVLSETDLYVPTEQFYALTPFFSLCTVLLTCLLVLFIERFRFSILPILLTIPLVESGLYFGAVPKYYYFFPYVIFLILSLSLIRFRKKAIPKGFFSVFTILLSICFFLANGLLHTISYERPRKWNQIRNSIILQDYEQLSELLGFTISSPFSSSYSGINAGNLKGLGNKSKSSKTALIVSMPSSLSTVYLKGYVGTEYTKNQWTVQPEQTFQKKLPIFYENTSSTLKLSPLDYLSIEQNSGFIYQEEITITPKSADKNYAYVPYTMLPNDSISQVQDLYYTPKTRNSYTIPYGTEKGVAPITTSIFGQKTTISEFQSLVPNTDYSSYLELRTAYSEYADTYKEMPSSIQEELQEATKEIQTYASEHNVSYIEATYWYFTQSGAYTYTLQPGRTPHNTDATLYFLNESHKGYCVHFASAATLILRNLGIPARYVEGYIIPPTTVAKGTYDSSTNQYTFSVPVSNAHAWTEYYISGKGWTILDATPSSYYESLEQEETTTTETQSTTSTTKEHESTTEVETTTTASSDSTSTSTTTTKEETKETFSFSDSLKNLSAELKVFLEVILILSLLFLLLVFRRQWNLYARHKSFHQKENNQAAIAMLEWLFYLFTLKPPSNAEQNIITSRMKPLLDQAKYSQHTITKEELSEIEKLIKITEKRAKKQLPFSKRFFHQFLSKKTLR